MIQSPEDPPERAPDDVADLPHDTIDTGAPRRDEVTGGPTPAEDPQVQHALTAARAHADLLAAEIGDDLVGVYLVGSAALSDAWPHSDVDTVTVTRAAMTDRGQLARIHDQLTSQLGEVRYDTTYVPYPWLAEPPRPGTITPFSQDGTLRLDEPSGQLHPVSWIELTRAITAHGTPVGQLPIAIDVGRAIAYSKGNLSSYWAKTADNLQAAAKDKPADAPLTNPDPVVGTVLGAPRLAAFIDRLAQSTAAEDGNAELPKLVTKTEAGEWAAHHFPHFADLAQRSVAHRRGQDVAFTVADATAAAELVREVIVVVNSR